MYNHAVWYPLQETFPQSVLILGVFTIICMWHTIMNNGKLYLLSTHCPIIYCCCCCCCCYYYYYYYVVVIYFFLQLGITITISQEKEPLGTGKSTALKILVKEVS